MERVKGIEPSYEAWEAAVLPLNYTRTASDYRHATALLNHSQTEPACAFKYARCARDRVRKRQRSRQQLQRPRVVSLWRFVDGRVQRIVAQWQAQRRHVHAQLMALAGDG